MQNPTDWITAIATFLAVVAALSIAIWGDWLRSLASRPALTISISPKAPDCHRIQATGQALVQVTEGPTTRQELQPVTFDTYYCRLEVGNKGNAPAKNA